MLTKLLLVYAAVLLASCAWSEKSNWHLMDSGYSIDAVSANEFTFAVHVNQLKQLGGEINSPQFRLFVAERLKWSGICPSGWTLLPCADDGSCIQRTHRSVTVPGRCAAP
jgi:hypothetical protein